MNTPASSTPQPFSRYVWLLIIFTVTIFTVNLWSDGIYSAQEGRAAIVAQNMLDSGNWLHIDIKGGHETEKPIMCYWFYAASGALFGVNEFSVRLPSVLAGLVTVLLTCFLGCRIYDKKTGLISGFMLASMIGFVNLARLARIDMVLCAFFTGAMVLLYLGYFEKRRATKHLYWFYALLALSVLIKGPVTVALAGLCVIILAIKERNIKIFWELKPFSGLLIGLLITAPWYIYEIIRTDGAFAQDFFLNQNISRFTGINMSYCGGRRQAYLYYVPKLLAMSLPWVLLIIPMLIRFYNKLLKLRPKTYFLLAWFSAVFIFFSLAAIKRGDYLLPLFLPFALFLGRYVAMLIDEKFKIGKHWKSGWLAISLILIAALVIIKMGWFGQIANLAAQDQIPHISVRDGMTMLQVNRVILANFYSVCLAMLLVCALIGGILYSLHKGRLQLTFTILCSVLFGFYIIYYVVLDPAQNRFKTVKFFCYEARNHVPENAKVYYYGEWVTEAVFFMNRDYERVFELEKFSSADGTLNIKHIVTDPDSLRNMPEHYRRQLEVVSSTIPNHQYPLILSVVSEIH